MSVSGYFLSFCCGVWVFFCSCSSVRVIVPSATDDSVGLLSKKEKMTKEQRRAWLHKDLVLDTIPGISVAKAYEFLAGRKSVPVLVAIADSGVELDHEDLQGAVWKKPRGNSK